MIFTDHGVVHSYQRLVRQVRCCPILCCTLVATCELTNRMLIETASINERAAEKGLEPYTPNPMNGIQKYQPKKESRDE